MLDSPYHANAAADHSRRDEEAPLAVVSADGACGGAAGQTCAGGRSGGSCCSASGRCGSSKLHCGAGCQALFGLCRE